jgi:hypothetical protein
MIDAVETIIAPSAIERAMEIFESVKDRDRIQARKVLTDCISRSSPPAKPIRKSWWSGA